jgi:hypothetical protein
MENDMERRIPHCLLAAAALCIAATTTTHAAFAEVSPDPQSVVTKLRALYADTRKDCGYAKSAPAFLCSGVIIRATGVSNGSFHVWDPSDKDVKRNAISASWTRVDAPISSIWKYNQGIIFSPVLETSAGKEKLNIRCATPIDGATDSREQGGCGAHPQFPTESGPCQSQGIRTGAQWLALRNVQPASNLRACLFDVSDDNNTDSAVVFNEVIALMKSTSSQYNELVLQGWARDQAASRPIMAFFYVKGSAEGLASARFNQRDYWLQAGQFVPVVQVTLATATSGVQFGYAAGDQSPGICAASGVPRLSAIAEAAPLQVEMRTVGGVVIRPQEGAEVAAAVCLQAMQEARLARR